MGRNILVIFIIVILLCSCTNNTDEQGVLNESANKEIISKESEGKEEISKESNESEDKEDSSSSCINKKNPIVWNDKNFEAIIRLYLNKPDEIIYVEDLDNITKLLITERHIETNIKSYELTKEEISKINSKISMKDIDNFNNLEEIEFAGVDSLYVYKNCKNVKSITLWTCPLTNFKDIVNYSNLTSFKLNRSYIKDLSPLNNLLNLTTLDISGNGKPVNNIDGSEISNIDINDLCNLTNLENLQISLSRFDNFAEISNFINLKNLSFIKCQLDYNQLYNITDNENNILENLRLIEPLNLSGERDIIDISKFENLDNLKKATLYGEFKNIENLKNVEELWIYYSHIDKNEYFNKLKNLKKLRLYNCTLDSDKIFENISNLEEIILKSTDIVNLSSLKDNISLKKIDITDCKLKDISHIKNLHNLEKLLFHNNNISDISVLSKFPNLKYIMVSSNPIKDYSVLDELGKNKNITIYK